MAGAAASARRQPKIPKVEVAALQASIRRFAAQDPDRFSTVYNQRQTFRVMDDVWASLQEIENHYKTQEQFLQGEVMSLRRTNGWLNGIIRRLRAQVNEARLANRKQQQQHKQQ